MLFLRSHRHISQGFLPQGGANAPPPPREVPCSRLKWFNSFICGHCQKVKIQDHESEEIIIKFGVPQGSVLGPVLFNIYIRLIYQAIKDTKFIVHGFGDDHQVYKSFVKEQEYKILVKELPSCFAEIENWMASHYLQLNAGKTENCFCKAQSPF